MMQRKVPRTRAAEREPTQHETRVVYLESPLNRSRRFEYVHFTRPVICVVPAREHFELELPRIPYAGCRGIRVWLQTRARRVLRQSLSSLCSRRRAVITNPIAFDETLRSSVQEHVETRRLAVIPGRNGQQERLNGSVERRVKAERDFSLLRGPW
jgi:hypothetical protein